MWRLHAPATTAEAIFVMLEKTHETASAVEAGSIVFKNAAKLLSELFGFAKYLRKNAPFFFSPFRRGFSPFRRGFSPVQNPKKQIQKSKVWKIMFSANFSEIGKPAEGP